VADRRPFRRARWVLVGCGALLAGIGVSWFGCLRMPGESHTGALAPLEPASGELAGSLEREVRVLASEIGERNVMHPDALASAAQHIERELITAQRPVMAQSFAVDGVECKNLEITIPGRERAHEIVVVGAHYDSAPGTPGADDNASGVAALLALARRFGSSTSARTLRFVAFANEEPPYFQTANMGSVRYAKRSRERGERIVAMLSLESIGYFSSEAKSQHYPPPLGMFYPSRGDFLGFVGNTSSRELVRTTIASFREHGRIASEGAALPALLPGVGWSDQWAFWQEGYPAIMVTDTAPFRNPGYHQASDTPEKLDYERLTRVVEGLERVIADLCR
jgi:Peptidase family M28